MTGNTIINDQAKNCNISFGNRCGHKKYSPDFTIAKPLKTGIGGQPKILSELSNRVSEYYKRPSDILPTLNNANNSIRQQRSERRESCIRVLNALIKYIELASLRVGIPNGNQFSSIGVRYISGICNMNLRRTERAIADLKRAGILTVHKKVELRNGEYRSSEAVKCVSASLFVALGLGKWLHFERSRARDRLNKRQKKEKIRAGKGNNPYSSVSGHLDLLLSSIGNIGKGKRRRKTKNSADYQAIQADRQRKIASRALDYLGDDCPPEVARRKAEQELITAGIIDP